MAVHIIHPIPVVSIFPKANPLPLQVEMHSTAILAQNRWPDVNDHMAESWCVHWRHGSFGLSLGLEEVALSHIRLLPSRHRYRDETMPGWWNVSSYSSANPCSTRETTMEMEMAIEWEMMLGMVQVANLTSSSCFWCSIRISSRFSMRRTRSPSLAKSNANIEPARPAPTIVTVFELDASSAGRRITAEVRNSKREKIARVVWWFQNGDREGVCDDDNDVDGGVCGLATMLT